MSDERIIVSIDIGDETIVVGDLWFRSRKGRSTSSFSYHDAWLSHPLRFALEPLLSLSPGSFHTETGKAFFGSIGDSAPDRWGRILMQRARTRAVAQQEQLLASLSELDYLLGVYDFARQGALRFSRGAEGPFLSEGSQQSIPPFVRLPDLLAASNNLIADKESNEELQLLLAPGSSIGGARPKASVLDIDGSLAIVKFPRPDDDYTLVKWEAVALSLARKAGIHTAQSRIETVLDRPVLVLSRFDRDGTKRIPFLSAMSMVGAEDHEQRSYLEIADALVRYGANPTADLQELWRRIVFTVMISNTDDHLRNHAFLFSGGKGWRLSPAYDLNPNPLSGATAYLRTAIDFDNTQASIDLALSVHQEFRLSLSEGRAVVEQVKSAVRSWRETAKACGIGERECERMARAFMQADRS
jgi:serine/threonine-protein kinase HipA